MTAVISAASIAVGIRHRLGTGFVYPQRAPMQLGSIQCGDGGLRIRRLRHLHEREAAGLGSVAVIDDVDRLDRAEGGK